MLPPSDLKVLLTNTGGFGRAAAPMLDKTGFAWQAMFAPTIFLAVYVGPSALAATPLSAYFAAFAPDVIYNYGTPILRSDRVKEVFYHEFAHASHYAGLPAGERDNYWNANVAYVLTNEYLNNNSPYGTRGTPGSQRCAVIEMWGFHLGRHSADDKIDFWCLRVLIFFAFYPPARNASAPFVLAAFKIFILKNNLYATIIFRTTAFRICFSECRVWPRRLRSRAGRLQFAVVGVLSNNGTNHPTL